MSGSFHPRLKLRHLQCLVSLAHHRSVLKAAEALSHTPSAISKSLAELEEIVGARLFIRKRTGLELTSVGETLLSFGTQAFGMLHEGFQALESGQNVTEQIHIGVLPTVTATLLPKAILSFQADYRHVVICVHTGFNSELLKRLKRGELALVLGRLADPAEMYGVAFEHLYTEPMVMAVRPQHPLASMTPDVSDIAAFPMILPLEGSSIRRAAESFLIASGMGMPRQRVETLSDAVARSLVRHSDAIWFNPLGVLAPDFKDGTAVRLRIATETTSASVGLSTLSGGTPSKMVRLFTERIRALAEDSRTAGAAAQ